jgi:tripartite-type tricarboxylate transporter receptor subunit TctC
MRHAFTSLLAAAAIALTGATAVTAQDFPKSDTTMVVGWPAGGAADRTARLLAEFVSRELDRSVVVTNIPGAGGSTGVRSVTGADPQGYVIGLTGASIIPQSYMNPNAPGLDEIEPIVFIGPDPGALQVRADTGIETLDQFFEVLRADPGSIINGNDNPGGYSFILASLIEQNFGVEFSKVSYQGYAPTIAAIMTGEVMSTTLPVVQLIEQHKAGDIRILGVTGEERHFYAPEIPTFKEQGYDLVSGDWFIIYGPKGMPAEVKAFWEERFLAALSNPELLESAKNQGITIAPRDAAGAAEFVALQDETVYPILDAAGLVEARKK